MRDGEKCRLDISTWDSSPAKHSAAYATVIGVVTGRRSHLDDSSRILYYFHTIRIERSIDALTTEKGSSSLLQPRRDKKEELSVGQHALSSAGGFKYSFDGWYDEIFLYTIDEELISPLPRDWIATMEHDTSPCELLYLSYASRPWFQSPFTALQYLQKPERHLCYSIFLCHRCLSPFISQRDLKEHLQGYCHYRNPPGILLYNDTTCGRRVYYVDGAKELHYGRCLCLLGNCFLESKQVINDVDIYEFFVVTTPRESLPYVVGEMDEFTFRRKAACFDKENWDGNTVVGFFTRIKHTPDHCLSCIITLPMFQQQGIAFFMLDIAYHLTSIRQRLCGCKIACGSSGGAISRPFSPHGQILLLAYWRQRVTAALMQYEANHKINVSNLETSLSFCGVHAMVLEGGCYIHEEDLRFFAFNDERCFYARLAPDVAAISAPVRRKTVPTTTTVTKGSSSNQNNNNNNNNNNDKHDNEPIWYVPPPSEFIGSLLLFKSDVPNGERKKGAFDERFWARDANGRHPYTTELFHY